MPDLRAGGAERLHVNLSNAWTQSGYQIEFVLRNATGELIELLPDGVTIVDLKAKRVRDAFSPLVQYLREVQPDVLLAAMWPLTVIAPLAAKMAGFKGCVIISEHSPLSIAYAKKGNLHHMVMKASQALTYRLAGERIAVSSGVADDLANLSGLPRDKFKVIYNPAAMGNIPTEPPAKPHILQNANGPILLAVGTLKKVKRFDLLINAFARLPKELNARLCIVGEGPLRADLEQQIASLGLTEKVLLPGYFADMSAWYAHADLFVLSSDYEGFGNVIVEAMEYGLPIVSTDCPSGPREILCNGKYGALTPVGNSELLADAILNALHSKHDHHALKLRAQDFTVNKIADQYLTVMFPEMHEKIAK